MTGNMETVPVLSDESLPQQDDLLKIRASTNHYLFYCRFISELIEKSFGL